MTDRGEYLDSVLMAELEGAMKRDELNALINKCTTLEELQALGAELGYKENWAIHVWEARGRK